jgi:RNA polymerase sigma factor (sigma-70 family)
MADEITEAELERIYDDTIADLYGYASRRFGGQRELAEDVTQETWVRALRHWRRHGAPENPLGWLTTVARNLIVSHFRRRESVSIDSVSPAEVLAAVDANTVSDSAEVASLVSRALTRIPPAEAQLLETFHYDRLKMSQLVRLIHVQLARRSRGGHAGELYANTFDDQAIGASNRGQHRARSAQRSPTG